MPNPAASSKRPPPWALRILVLTYLTIFLFAPLLALGVESFREGALSLWQGITEPESLLALRNSFLLAAIAVVLNVLFGIAAGLVIARQRFWGRALLDGLIEVPLALSPVMVGLAFILIFGRTGWLGPWLSQFGVRVIFSFPGLIIATLFVTVPFTAREVIHVLSEIGEEEEMAATTLGASRWQTFWHVTLPNMRGALSCGISLTAARALGEFGAVLIMGGAITGSTHTATTWIFTAVDERNNGAALGLSLVLGLCSVVLLLLVEKLRARAHERR
ncbi:MAG: sulfate ABC transporter permease subunit [Proteobacteria bacterium]|nr:sulfate ABC transporter permease subunit [Pseudomonadota bacterium]